MSEIKKNSPAENFSGNLQNLSAEISRENLLRAAENSDDFEIGKIFAGDRPKFF